MATTIISCTKSLRAQNLRRSQEKLFAPRTFASWLFTHFDSPLVRRLKILFPSPRTTCSHFERKFLADLILPSCFVRSTAERSSAALSQRATLVGGIIAKCEENATCLVRLSASSFSPALLFLSTSHSKRREERTRHLHTWQNAMRRNPLASVGRRDEDSEIKRLRSQF